MNDYCARESTPVDNEACVRKLSAKEIISGIRKELAETILCLAQIELSLCGEPGEGKKQEEPKCMNDELKYIDRMAMECIALSHDIHNKLFGTDEI